MRWPRTRPTAEDLEGADHIVKDLTGTNGAAFNDRLEINLSKA
jgi:hypothetical protein